MLPCQDLCRRTAAGSLLFPSPLNRDTRWVRIRRLGWDPAGPTFAWVGALSLDYRTTEHFDVFSPTGAWLASVSLPPRVQVLDIRQGRILATQCNDLGVNAVTVFRIEGW